MSSVDVPKSDIKNVDGRMTGFGAGKGDHR